MELKKILNFVFGIFLLMSVANGATFFDSYHMTFSDVKPNNMFVQTYVCEDASCSEATSIDINYYMGDAIACYNDNIETGDEVAFLSCMEDYRLPSNVLNLYNQDTISSTGEVYMFAEYDTENAPFGYMSAYYTSGDTYVPYRIETTRFDCESNTCVDVNAKSVIFDKVSDAIAEIGQLNIRNVDNDLLPVQVEVPVFIEESVCSAFRFTDSNVYTPVPPVGYSDFSANTRVSLTITNEDAGGAQLYTQEITIPILADTCAGLAAFSWTPSSSLEDVRVKFRVETEVIDEQVDSSIVDWTEVFETVYPENLDGACWARSYDFTLSNIASTEMTTSVAQITVGESLYAVFDAGAYRDESVTPMYYDAELFFDGILVYSNTYMSLTDLRSHIIDITDEISGLSAGAYDVRLAISPRGSGCTISDDVVQVQNLQLLEPTEFEVRFHVRDPNYLPLDSANVNLVLQDADDYYVVDPVFNENLLTNGNGLATFTGVIRGDYRYTVSSSSSTSVTNNVHIGGPTDIYITLVSDNVAPVISLPTSFLEYYRNPIEFDVRNYITDFNDDIEDLVISYRVVSGTLNVNFNGQDFTITDDAPSINTLEITVTDPDGSSATDTVEIIFINNQAPVVNEFVASPDNGPVTFIPAFRISVSDSDGDTLMCTLEFGDGTETTNICGALNNMRYAYTSEGTYVATLTVDDGYNEPVVVTEEVFVFVKDPSPIINMFQLASTNGIVLPTDLTLDWYVSHNNGYPMTCTLRVNGVNNAVACTDTFNIFDYNISGEARFTLIAVDNESNQETRQIIETFYNPGDVLLNNVGTELVMGDVVEPGEFEFFVETNNETLERRFIDVTPSIIYDDVVIDLPGLSNKLESGAVSSNVDEAFVFAFDTNTLDYEALIPKDVPVTFRVVLTDEYNSRVVLEKEVIFSYAEEEEKYTSISGEGSDIIDYMETTVVNGLGSGYNTVKFNVVNNEQVDKDLSISMISTQLDLEFRTEVGLAKGQTETVTMPLFIGKNVKPGMYPARFTVRDGDDTHSKYSYIVVR